MKKSIKNINEEELNIDIIRYFENNGSEYLIYSLNENVGDDYIKLYASKIIGNSACIIEDNSEWALIKEIVKDIIKCNHEGLILQVIDLDEDELDNINLQDTRVFKLQGNLVNLLSDNKGTKKEKKSEIIDEELHEIEETEEEIDIEEKDYLKSYNEELEQNLILKEKIKELEMQIENYKLMIEKIKMFIEE